MEKLNKQDWRNAAEVMFDWTEQDALEWRNARILATSWDGLESVIQEHWWEWMEEHYAYLEPTWYYDALKSELGRKLLTRFFKEMEEQSEG